MYDSAGIVDLVVVLAVAEALGIVGYRLMTGRGPAPGGFMANMLSGISLLVALRCAIGGAWFGWIALCLLASLLFNLIDLRRRWDG
jgi:hypothetical protein